MKKILLTALALGLAQAGYSQTVDSQFKVGKWRGFAGSAVSHTFDDNIQLQLDTVVPLFDEYGFNLTLYTMTDAWTPANWDDLNEAASNGHEIGSHSVTHTSFGDLNDAGEKEELVDSQQSIWDEVSTRQSLTFAYPYCATGNDSLVTAHYIAARVCSGTINSSSPSNFARISSIIVGSEGSVKTATDLNTRVRSGERQSGWTVFLYHAIDNSGGYSPIASDEIESHLAFLSDNPEDYWVDSFVNVVKYIRERNSVSVTQISANDDTVQVSVSDTLSNDIYDYPISLEFQLPDGWDSASVQQNMEVIPTYTDGDKLYFDLVPDSGSIYITRQATTAVSNEEQPELPESAVLYRNFPNPFNPSTVISYQLAENSRVSLKVFDALGREVAALVNGYKTAGKYTVEFKAENIPSGVYLYRLDTENSSLIQRMTLIK